jgi:lipid-binding SYLF domain-containing protein
MRHSLKRCTRYLCAVLLALPLAGRAGPTEDAKLADATAVMHKLMADPDQAIPADVLSHAHGIAVIPNTIRGGFLVGGRRGRGVLAVRAENGAWTSPTFLTLTAGSIGWQIGAESADIVLVFANPESIENIERGKFSLTADITAVAGPEGHHSTAAVTWDGEVYAYVLGRGLFAGAAFEGARIGIDAAANERYYGAGGQPLAVPGPSTPPSARDFIALLQGAAPARDRGSPASTQEAIIYPLGR